MKTTITAIAVFMALLFLANPAPAPAPCSGADDTCNDNNASGGFPAIGGIIKKERPAA